MKKSFKYIFIGIIIFSAGAFGFYRFWLLPQHTTPILMYHYVNNNYGSLSVTPENFERQMKYLKERGYNVISLDDFIVGKKAGHKFSHRTVVITFDDGWADNYEHAYPVLKKYGYPATIFIITQFMGQEPYLTWDQTREMAENGINFGSHTQHHPYLPTLPETEMRREIFDSKKDIESFLNTKAHHFCYPLGGFTERSKELIKEAGYHSASTTNRGHDPLNDDLYELTRVKVTNSDAVKPFHFWGKLSGYYNVFRSSRPGH